jgi:hypothetical protein
MLRNFVVASFAALVVGAVTASCGGGPRNLCADRNISCESPLSCDPSDGICKCGGRGGVVCPTGFSCDPVSNTCLSARCARVDCSDRPGTSCDVFDGICKCGGTGGVACLSTEACNPNAKTCEPRISCTQVACPANQTCDQATGACRCGASACAVGQRCSIGMDGAKACVNDACTGVTCTGSNTCDAADGLCKCNGVVCQSGEACACPPGADGGCAASQLACRSGNACANVTCGNNTTCDPVDGLCKCGGPGGPVCASNQICNLGPPAQCQGGAQCSLPDGGAKSCAGGTSCDPEDGKCKCGGRGGIVCAPASTDGGSAPAEICVQNPVQQACRQPCDIRSPVCPQGTHCYYDSSATTPAAYCAAPTDMRKEDDACTVPTACFSTSPSPRSIHCLGLVLGQTGICRAYCDVAAGSAGCIQVPRPQTCIAIPQAPSGYGYCNPM